MFSMTTTHWGADRHRQCSSKALPTDMGWGVGVARCWWHYSISALSHDIWVSSE